MELCLSAIHLVISEYQRLFYQDFKKILRNLERKQHLLFHKTTHTTRELEKTNIIELVITGKRRK